MARTPLFSFRVHPDTLASWRSAAEGRGQSISAWLHDAASAHVEAKPPGARQESTWLGRKAFSRPKPRAEDGCTHPKGAIVVVNAGLGLARCGACGANRRADGTWSE